MSGVSVDQSIVMIGTRKSPFTLAHLSVSCQFDASVGKAVEEIREVHVPPVPKHAVI